MQAWRFATVEAGLSLTEVPDPKPADNEVLIDVLAAGLCHTDVGIIEGHLTPFTLPLTLGHEICGTIADIGAGVTEWKVGQRVAVVDHPGGTGTGRDGGYASQVLGDTDWLIALPEGVDDASAAVATDAGVTAYRAVLVRGAVQAGMKVGIIGLGGLGMIGAQLARGAGAEVYAAEIKESLFPLAADQGVVACSTSITDFADKELDVIVDFCGMDTANSAMKAIRPGGRIVQVGIGKPQATIDLFDVLMKQVDYLGSSSGSREDLAAFLNLLAKGEVTPMVERIRFDEIGEGLERLRRGEATGRLVAIP